jgi:hypothetical protein
LSAIQQDSDFLVILNYRNGAFSAQKITNSGPGDNGEFWPCSSSEMVDAFKDMYHFMHSPERTGIICGAKVNKRSAKTGKDYFEVDFKIIRYRVNTPKDPKKPSVLVWGYLPLEIEQRRPPIFLNLFL